MVRKKAPKDVVTLVSADYNGETLLAISLDWVVSELTTYTTLLYASTVEDVKADAHAFELVSGRWQFEELGDEDDAEADADGSVDNRSFDAETYFGDDYSWRPEARFDSRAWLGKVLPDLQAALEQPDTAWGSTTSPHHSSTWNTGRPSRTRFASSRTRWSTSRASASSTTHPRRTGGTISRRESSTTRTVPMKRIRPAATARTKYR